MLKALTKSFVLLSAFAVIGFGASTKITGPLPSVYVAPDHGFEVSIAGAIAKKHVPARVVVDETLADYTLVATGVEVHRESTGSKVARCIFAYCAGIQDSNNVSVQLIDTRTKTVVWGYNVTKQMAVSARNRQSMAEAIAKHLKNDFLAKRAAE